MIHATRWSSRATPVHLHCTKRSAGARVETTSREIFLFSKIFLKMLVSIWRASAAYSTNG
jgi:hypothetical protein